MFFRAADGRAAGRAAASARGGDDEGPHLLQQLGDSRPTPRRRSPLGCRRLRCHPQAGCVRASPGAVSHEGLPGTTLFVCLETDKELDRGRGYYIEHLKKMINTSPKRCVFAPSLRSLCMHRTGQGRSRSLGITSDRCDFLALSCCGYGMYRCVSHVVAPLCITLLTPSLLQVSPEGRAPRVSTLSHL